MKDFLKRHGEFLRYALWGIAAVAADLGVYALTVDTLGIRLANGAGWAAALITAFLTNKYFVFRRRHEGIKALLLEFLEFAAARAASLVVQVWGTDALVRRGFDRPLLGVRGGAAKTIITVLVIAMNYVFSKFLIFRSREAA